MFVISDMKTKKKARAAAVRAAGAICAFALLLPLTSCSIITINYDKFSRSSESTGESEHPVTEPTVTTPYVTDAETEFVPPTEHEYTGMQTAMEMLSGISYDFGGQSVFIRSTDKYGIERMMLFSEEDTDSYSIARYERNLMIEEALGCKLNYTDTTLSEMTADLRAAVKNERYYADLLALTSADMTSLAKAGLLLSLYSLPFFDIDAEYFHPATSELAAGNDAYGVVSYATIDPDDIGCVFYDVKRVTGDPESLAWSGEWTWDAMLTLAGTGGIAVPADGDGEADADRLSELTAASAGLRFVSNSRGETPTVTLPEGIAAAADVCRRLLTESAVPTDGTEEFAAGNSVFYIGTLGDMEALASADVVWGVLPMPKVTGQENSYRALMPETSIFMSVPINTTNASGASALLRAFAASSYAYLADAYEEYHMYNTVRIESSVDMIGLIYGTAYYDFAHVYASLGDGLPEGTYRLVAEAVKNENADIDSLYSKRRKTANSALSGLFSIRG